MIPNTCPTQHAQVHSVHAPLSDSAGAAPSSSVPMDSISSACPSPGEPWSASGEDGCALAHAAAPVKSPSLPDPCVAARSYGSAPLEYPSLLHVVADLTQTEHPQRATAC